MQWVRVARSLRDREWMLKDAEFGQFRRIRPERNGTVRMRVWDRLADVGPIER